MPFLSICIPTFNRPAILRDVLQSIFSQPVDTSLYEVCVSDNAKTDVNEKMIREHFPNQQNLVYNRSTCEGFYNSIEALKLGRGTYLKLLNDTGKFRPGALARIIDVVKNKQENTVFFFTMEDEQESTIPLTFHDFDSFFSEITYKTTWSSATCIGKDNLTRILEDNTAIDKMFPQTSLIFAMTEAPQYIVDNYKYIDTVESKKGGYNFAETFGVRYMNMVKELYGKNKIKKESYRKNKQTIVNFIASWYVTQRFDRETFKYDFSHKTKHIFKSCGFIGLLRFYYDVFKNIRKYKKTRKSILLQEKH